jgi:hypothetical protein
LLILNLEKFNAKVLIKALYFYISIISSFDIFCDKIELKMNYYKEKYSFQTKRYHHLAVRHFKRLDPERKESQVGIAMLNLCKSLETFTELIDTFDEEDIKKAYEYVDAKAGSPSHANPDSQVRATSLYEDQSIDSGSTKVAGGTRVNAVKALSVPKIEGEM